MSRAASDLDDLATLTVNFDHREGPTGPSDTRWHVDTGRALIGTERPGPPEPDGLWETACRIVKDYQFTDHRRLRAIFRPADALHGRDMLLEGRFSILRFYLGVRVTAVVDTEHDGHRVWGWTYDTLQGHLEQGRLTYEVDKDLTTGDVSFWIKAFSRRARVPNPLYRLGFGLFGRAIQLEFYHQAGQRVRELARDHLDGAPSPSPTDAGDGAGPGVVIAPHGSPSRWSDRFVVHVHNPGV